LAIVRRYFRNPVLENGIGPPFGADPSTGYRDADMLPRPFSEIANQCVFPDCGHFRKAISVHEPTHEFGARPNPEALKFLHERPIGLQQIERIGRTGAISRPLEALNRMFEFGLQAAYQ